jgi:hypothetical protein
MRGERGRGGEGEKRGMTEKLKNSSPHHPITLSIEI